MKHECWICGDTTTFHGPTCSNLECVIEMNIRHARWVVRMEKEGYTVTRVVHEDGIEE